MSIFEFGVLSGVIMVLWGSYREVQSAKDKFLSEAQARSDKMVADYDEKLDEQSDKYEAMIKSLIQKYEDHLDFQRKNCEKEKALIIAHYERLIKIMKFMDDVKGVTNAGAVVFIEETSPEDSSFNKRSAG